MIVLVAGAAEWPKLSATLDYFHGRFAFTKVIGENALARRWAMERGVPNEHIPAVKAMAQRGLERAIIFDGAPVVIDLARARGLKVVEVC